MSRKDVNSLLNLLFDAQGRAIESIMNYARYETLEHITPDNFTMQDTLRMWVWHFWTHHRDLVLARGDIEGDNPHFHVLHFLRQANEEFGRFVGELACLNDEQLDLKMDDEQRSAREVAEHVLVTLTEYIPSQIANAKKKENSLPSADTTGSSFSPSITD